LRKVIASDPTPSAQTGGRSSPLPFTSPFCLAYHAGRTCGRELLPVYHWTPHRICAHVSLGILALLLERVAENACEDTWRNIRDDLRQIQLAELSSPDGTIWQITEPAEEAANRLKLLKINKPPPILRFD
jgi:hypothetical protein